MHIDEGDVMDIYKICPVLQNDKLLLRLVNDGDADALLKVYGDIKAVPLFNSDNCHGDDFHYATVERVRQALDFWQQAYENGWFVRFAVIDKAIDEVIGTIEGFRREADDCFNDCALLRIDLRSDCETAEKISSLLSLIVPPSFEMFGCSIAATKAVPSATDRIGALTAFGFVKSHEPLIGHDGTEYYDYYVYSYDKDKG